MGAIALWDFWIDGLRIVENPFGAIFERVFFARDFAQFLVDKVTKEHAMELFKLIFDHDLRLDDLLNPPHSEEGVRGVSHADGSGSDANGSTSANARALGPNVGLEAFMKPDLTYSRLYLSGTQLTIENFGLSILSRAEEIIHATNTVIGSHRSLHSAYGEHSDLLEAVRKLNYGQAVVLAKDGSSVESSEVLRLGVHSGVEPAVHRKLLGSILKEGHAVIYKEKAHHGFDLQIYSLQNFWRELFLIFQPLILSDGTCRFFSINAKRMRSERLFYFETWSLVNPPHGFEEVFKESVL